MAIFRFLLFPQISVAILIFSIMCSLIWLICFKFICVQSLYIPKGNAKNETAEEIQNAICTITTKEIEASANATITRQLKGVCTSNELTLKIDKLQTKILQEIDGIKYILEINGFRMPDGIPLKNAPESSDFQDYTVSFIYKGENTTKLSPRIEKILMYNDSVVDSGNGSTYFYYWKIENIWDLLAKRDMYKSSPDFSVLGHDLHLQLYPNYLEDKLLGLQLRPRSSGFLKKHKITILSQFSPSYDIDSGVIYGNNAIYRVSEKTLVLEGYIVENSLIVKLEIYLDS